MNRASTRGLRLDRRRGGAAVRPCVALVLDGALSDYPSLVRGCVDAAQQTGRINLFYRGFHGGTLRDEVVAAGPNVAGILVCRMASPENARYLRRQRCPVVLMEQDRIAGLPLVRADNAAIGRMAAEFLLARGHRRFAYWGVAGACYSDQRERSFVEAIRRAGGEFVANRLPPIGADLPQIRRAMKRFLSADRPIAMLVDTTTHARQIVAMCQQLGYVIPEEVAILSGDNDDLLGATIHPSISGIDQNLRRIAYEAVMLMTRLIDGGSAPPEPLLIPPAGVVERQSTDSFAVEDRRLALALNRIRTSAIGGKVGIGEVAHAAGLSRRALQLRFRKRLSRTVQQEITRVRIDHAKHLLATTNLPMPDVAVHSGYESAPVFTRAFRRTTGITPLSFRHGKPARGLAQSEE